MSEKATNRAEGPYTKPIHTYLPNTTQWDSMSKAEKLTYWRQRIKAIEKKEKRGMSCKRERARVEKRIDELTGTVKREKKEEEAPEEQEPKTPEKPRAKGKRVGESFDLTNKKK